jgi:hypothetical protein
MFNPKKHIPERTLAEIKGHRHLARKPLRTVPCENRGQFIYGGFDLLHSITRVSVYNMVGFGVHRTIIRDVVVIVAVLMVWAVFAVHNESTGNVRLTMARITGTST